MDVLPNAMPGIHGPEYTVRAFVAWRRQPPNESLFSPVQQGLSVKVRILFYSKQNKPRALFICLKVSSLLQRVKWVCSSIGRVLVSHVVANLREVPGSKPGRSSVFFFGAFCIFLGTFLCPEKLSKTVSLEMNYSKQQLLLISRARYGRRYCPYCTSDSAVPMVRSNQNVTSPRGKIKDRASNANRKHCDA